ncbi:MAG: His/Gly/Thr/Pro-type tRNA ligase C-terminal domain-containing protein [Candidatus Pacebacteria bacterium]|nr:His/Gly/Thr/Pro-type tRNA ligase C-terminal domain-containing protein [Candidatus Paceibacterota bacterium]
MKQSKLFTKISKEISKEETSKNAQLLIRAGFIDKLMSGVYSYLPLGLMVFKKIENIIREEMNNISGQEVLLPALLPKENWEKTGRWKYPEMLKLQNRAGKDFSLGWTHEEIITPLVKKFVKSYKDLPIYVYQFQNKFRDELRAKSGLLRGIEFSMKDLYSFHKNQEDLDEYYEKVKAAYFKIFKRCGLEKVTFLTLASGGAFAKYSHEFQTETLSGEDEIYFCKKCDLAINKEIIEEEKHICPECGGKDLEIKKSIEVGNIFKLGKRFSEPFDFMFRDKDGKENPIIMGCYGIGLGRLMGTIVEIYNDEKGIIWPKEVSPFSVHLIAIESSEKVKNAAEKLYKNLQEEKIEVLYDDREDKTAGEKFAECDLIGIPTRIVVSERTLEKDCVEVKKRSEKESKLVKINEVSSSL